MTCLLPCLLDCHDTSYMTLCFILPHSCPHPVGAVRITPVGLAYRHAPPDTLAAAVDTACLFTHPHEDAREGARITAAAVAWLAR